MQMAQVVQLSDRCSSGNQDFVQAEMQLRQIAVVMAIVYLVLFICFWRFAQMEPKHSRVIHDVDVSFELEEPHVEPIKQPEPEQILQIAKLPGPNGGSAAAPKPLPVVRKEAPAIKAEPTAATQAIQAAPVKAPTDNQALPTVAKPVDQIPKPTDVAEKQAPTAATTPVVAAAENQQQTSGTNANSAAGGDATGTGTGGVGAGGTGTGAGGPGAGSGTGPGGGLLVASAPRLGNIAPYRKDLLIRLAQNWHPKNKTESLIVMLTINHEGKVLSDEVVQSSGNSKADDDALGAIASTEFAPLPDWFKGDHLQFKINLDKVSQLQASR
jgi:TonB family protein